MEKIIIRGSKRVTKEGREFVSYYTKIKGKEGSKSISVKFDNSLKLPKYTPFEIEVEKEDFTLPKFTTPFKNKQGEMIYPYIYVKKFNRWNKVSDNLQQEHSTPTFEFE